MLQSPYPLCVAVRTCSTTSLIDAALGLWSLLPRHFGAIVFSVHRKDTLQSQKNRTRRVNGFPPVPDESLPERQQRAGARRVEPQDEDVDDAALVNFVDFVTLRMSHKLATVILSSDSVLATAQPYRIASWARMNARNRASQSAG